MTTKVLKRKASIPVLYTRGSHFDVGFNVGRTFLGIIQNAINNCSYLRKTLLPAYETDAGRTAYDETLQQLQRTFPQYVDEIRGTAEGANVPFHYLLVIHIDMILQKTTDNSNERLKGCTDMFLNTNHNALLFHTEDGSHEFLNHMYILDAEIERNEKLKTPSESFASLCYPGFIPGKCMSINRKGFVSSLNVIPAKDVPGNKINRNFLMRATLAASSVVEVEDILKCSGVGGSDALSVNLAFVKANTYSMYNIEVGPAVGDSICNTISTVQIHQGAFYAHTNTFLRLNYPHGSPIIEESSKRRLKRISEFDSPKTKNELLNIISDTKDEEFPIFKNGAHPDPWITCCVGEFDLNKQTWTLWTDNPLLAPPQIVLPLSLRS